MVVVFNNELLTVVYIFRVPYKKILDSRQSSTVQYQKILDSKNKGITSLV